ncbi:MAG: hypothetical protein AB7S77_15090 [Desulfatirhabdiaceae bacterium]
MQLKKAELTKIFNKLNLEVRTTTHHYGWLIYQGKKILRVHYSHGKGDLPGKVSDKIRSQLKLSQNDFKGLINCPLSAEDYIGILKRKGIVDDAD